MGDDDEKNDARARVWPHDGFDGAREEADVFNVATRGTQAETPAALSPRGALRPWIVAWLGIVGWLGVGAVMGVVFIYAETHFRPPSVVYAVAPNIAGLATPYGLAAEPFTRTEPTRIMHLDCRPARIIPATIGTHVRLYVECASHPRTIEVINGDIGRP